MARLSIECGGDLRRLGLRVNVHVDDWDLRPCWAGCTASQKRERRRQVLSADAAHMFRRQRFIAAPRPADDAEMAAGLATDDEAEIIAELQAEDELWSEWNAPPRARDEDDVELDAMFDEALERND